MFLHGFMLIIYFSNPDWYKFSFASNCSMDYETKRNKIKQAWKKIVKPGKKLNHNHATMYYIHLGEERHWHNMIIVCRLDILPDTLLSIILKPNSCTKILAFKIFSTYRYLIRFVNKTCSNGYHCTTFLLYSKALKDKNFPHPEVVIYY